MDRANKEHQLQFLQSLKDSGRLDLLLSELQEAPSSTMASMHDGTKRRMFSPATEEFDLVDPAEFTGNVWSPPKSHYQAPVVPKASTAAPSVESTLPKKVPSMIEWGRTVCELPKYKSKNWCYAEMVTMATSESQIHSYLGWITRNGQVSLKVQDFANYLAAIGWTEFDEADQVYYPGTCDVRRLK